MRSLCHLAAVVLVLTSVASPVLGFPPGPRIEPFHGSPTVSEESNETRTPTTSNPTTNPEVDSDSPEETTESRNPFATAEPAAFDGTCSGLGPFSGNICNGVLAAVNDLARGFLEFARDIAEWAVEFLVSRPVPVRDGTPEFIDRPTNAPMDTVYDLWFTLGLPAGLGLWALFMLFFRAEALLPGHVVTARQARVLELKGWLALFGILGSWIWCAFLLYLSSGLADWFAPAGAEIATSFERILSGAVAAGLGAILLWLSTGVLFVFVALVFGLSWLAVYVLIPAMPVLIALSLPAVWIFRPVASIGRQLRELFVPAAFVPFPTAVILGVGYPVINAIHSSLDGGLADFAGVDSFAYILLVLVLWFCAALSPVFLFVGSRRLRPFAMLTAGALGAASGAQISRSSQRLRDRIPSKSFGKESASSVASNAGAGVRVDPLQGSPFSRTNRGGDSGGLGGRSTAGALEGDRRSKNGLTPSPDQTSGNGQATRTSANTSSTTEGGRTASAYTKTIPDGVSFQQVSSREELDQRRYDAGYFDTQGEFKSVSQGPSDSGWLLDEGGFKWLNESRSEDSIVLYDERNTSAYDVRPVASDGQYRKSRYRRQHRDSIRTLERTREK